MFGTKIPAGTRSSTWKSIPIVLTGYFLHVKQLSSGSLRVGRVSRDGASLGFSVCGWQSSDLFQTWHVHLTLGLTRNGTCAIDLFSALQNRRALHQPLGPECLLFKGLLLIKTHPYRSQWGPFYEIQQTLKQGLIPLYLIPWIPIELSGSSWCGGKEWMGPRLIQSQYK